MRRLKIFLENLVRFQMLASIFEGLVLISSTLLLCALYLNYVRHVAVRPWIVIFSLAIPISFAGAAWASYRAALMLAAQSECAKFRITRQTLRTLSAERMKRDVVDGLRDMLGDQREITFKGEKEFDDLLNDLFGPARACEIEPTIFKYARL